MTPTYKDKGCKLHSSCLDCPIPTTECPLFTKGGTTYYEKQKRNSTIRKLFSEGKSVKELVLIFGIGTRTIQKILRGRR